MSARGGIGLAIVLALLALALAGDRISGYRFDAQDSANALASPSAAHWLGCDALGRDLFARLGEGARVSLVIAVGATGLALLVGLAYGALSGWVGGGLAACLEAEQLDPIYALPDVVIVLLIEVFSAALSGSRSVAAAGSARVRTRLRRLRPRRAAGGRWCCRREETWSRRLGRPASPTRILVRTLPNIAAPQPVSAAFPDPGHDPRQSTSRSSGSASSPVLELGTPRATALKQCALTRI